MILVRLAAALLAAVATHRVATLLQRVRASAACRQKPQKHFRSRTTHNADEPFQHLTTLPNGNSSRSTPTTAGDRPEHPYTATISAVKEVAVASARLGDATVRWRPEVLPPPLAATPLHFVTTQQQLERLAQVGATLR